MTAAVLATAVGSLVREVDRVDSGVRTMQRIPLTIKAMALAAMFMPRLVASFLARRVDKFSETLAHECIELHAMRRDIAERSDVAELIDPESKLDQRLDALKLKLDTIRQRSEQVVRKPHPKGFEKCRDAMARLGDIAVEVRAAVNDLQWEVAEHDAPLLGMVDAASVSSSDELEALLARITA